MHSGIRSLDPAFARAQFDIWGCNQLYNGLLQLDDSLQVVPAIARGYQVEDGGKLYRFHLRQDVRFHDSPVFPNGKGRRVVAADFVFSFNRLIDPALASPGAWIFNDKIIFDSTATPPTGSFTAINDSTLEIRLREPFPPFAGLLSMQYCSVIPHEAASFFGKDFRRNPVGTGPFRFGNWDEENMLVLKRNDHYFETENGQPLPYLDAVCISFMANRQNEFFAFLQHNLDLLSGIDPSFKDNLLTPQGKLRPQFEGEFVMEKIPFLNTEYFGILRDTNSPVLRNNPLRMRQVRQAINYGFDREKMMRYLRNNIGRPATAGMVPPGLPSFSAKAVEGYSYNPQKALRLLEEAGFPNGQGLPEIACFTNPTYMDIAVFIQRQLQDIGIRLKIETTPPSEHRQYMAEKKMPFFRASWIADYPDAENYLALFYSPFKAPAGPNYTHFGNPTFDSLYEASRLITNDSARYPLYHRMERLVMEDAPVVVLFYDEVIRLIGNDVRGLNRNALNLVSLKRVRKE